MTAPTLAEFLLARIAEDEAAAQAATPGPWYWEPPSDDAWPQGDEDLRSSGKRITYDYGTRSDGSRIAGEYDALVVSSWGHDAWGTVASDEDRAHIARHDPARVLAVCEAHRRIVEAHPRSVALDYCETCFSGDFGRLDDPLHEDWPCPTLRALAAIYADRDGWREEWR